MGGIEKVLLFKYMYRHQFDFATIFFGKGKFHIFSKIFGIFLSKKNGSRFFSESRFFIYQIKFYRRKYFDSIRTQ